MLITKLKNSYHTYALITILFWSLTYALTKICMTYFTSQALAFLRYFIAFLTMLIFIAFYRLKLPRKRDWIWFFLSGFFGFAFYTIVFNKGTALVTSATSSLVIASIPIITALLASVTYKEKLKGYQWVATLVEFAGIAVVTLWHGVFSINIGILLLLVAALSFSVYNLCQRRLLRIYPALQCSVYSMIAAMILLTPGSVQTVRQLPGVGAEVLVSVLIMAVFCSALAYNTWVKALSLAKKTSYVTNYMFLSPVLATLWGFLLLREVPDLGTLIGGAMILCGLIIFNQESFREALHRA